MTARLQSEGRIIAVMRLGLKKGDEVTIFCKGKDEARVCEELALLFG